MKTEKKQKTVFVETENDDRIIEQLRRNTVINYFTNKEKEELSQRLRKVVSDIVKS